MITDGTENWHYLAVKSYIMQILNLENIKEYVKIMVFVM